MMTITTDPSRRRCLRRGLATAAALALPLHGWAHGGEVPRITVWRQADCECCLRWARHLENSLFVVDVRTVADLRPIRRALQVPEGLAACHTARIDDYVVEGHVPATDLHRLLAERPSALGLAVPGMPKGSPGMEAEGSSDRFDVLLFQADGRTSVFKSYPL